MEDTLVIPAAQLGDTASSLTLERLKERREEGRPSCLRRRLAGTPPDHPEQLDDSGGAAYFVQVRTNGSQFHVQSSSPPSKVHAICLSQSLPGLDLCLLR